MGLDMYLDRSDGEEIYWRKANQIEGWFARRGLAQNGQYVSVSYEELKQLLFACERVSEDHELASEILPRTSGFFFGSQEYDEWYFKDIEFTIEELTRLLNDPDASKYKYTYYESW